MWKLGFLWRVKIFSVYEILMKPSNTVIIIAATQFWYWEMSSRMYLKNCPELPCRISKDPADYNKSEAVVFHYANLHYMNISKLPKVRLPNQYYVFFCIESPRNTVFSFQKWRYFFNWTMTYRLDSDIPLPHGYVLPKETPLDKTKQAMLQKAAMQFYKLKSGFAVWFASNCNTPSQREQLVDELKKYIDIDVFGKCGNQSHCPQRWGDMRKKNFSCEHNLINNRYYFYLAFENTICPDYITEKYWSRWKLHSIPIVLKRAIYEHHVPAHSFISVDDFPTISSFALYLKKLTANETEYLSYFKWKETDYQLSTRDKEGNHFGFCRMCEILLSKQKPEKKNYANVGDFWSRDQCDSGELVRKYLNSAPQILSQGNAS